MTSVSTSIHVLTLEIIIFVLLLVRVIEIDFRRGAIHHYSQRILVFGSSVDLTLVTKFQLRSLTLTGNPDICVVTCIECLKLITKVAIQHYPSVYMLFGISSGIDSNDERFNFDPRTHIGNHHICVVTSTSD